MIKAFKKALVSAVMLMTAFTFCLPTTPAYAQINDVVIYFSPSGGAEHAIIRTLDGAQDSIYIAMYSFTNPVLTRALINAHQRGVKIHMKVDYRQAQGASMKKQLAILKNSGIKIQLSSLTRTMHHKFAVVDLNILICGSYNWTTNAERNNKENLLIIKSPGMSRIFLDEFQRIE